MLLHRPSRSLFTRLAFRQCTSGSGSGGGGASGEERDPSIVKEVETSPVDALNNKVLYKGNEGFSCRLLLSVSSFNAFYWTYYLTNCYFYDGVVIQGVELGGNPTWGYFGAFCTGLMFYASQQFSHHAVYRAYESSDGLRIGFQMHNLFGQPGRKLEVAIGNARLLDGTGKSNLGLGGSYLLLRVVGVNRNVILDHKGQFFYNSRLYDLLERGVTSSSHHSKDESLVQSKQELYENIKKSVVVAKQRKNKRRIN